MRRILMGMSFLSFLCIVLIASNSRTTYAQTSGDYEYKLLSNGTVEITDYSGDDVNLIVPTKLDNKKVTVLGNGSFQESPNLVEVTIPDGITDVNSTAFSSCEKLEVVNISKSVTYISLEAFNWDSNLQYINVDENNKVYTSIDGILFSKDKSTIYRYPPGKPDSTYTIPDIVTSIDSAFASCSNLQTVTLSKNIKRIGAYTFGWCEGLTSVVIPEGVEELEDWAFTECMYLSEVTIPGSITSFGDAFSRCSRLSSINVDPDNKILASIDGVLFSKDLSRLLKYPSNRRESSYIIPDTVKTIESCAFDMTRYSDTVTIHAGVSNIAEDAFVGYNSLLNINVDENNNSYCSVDGVLFNKDKTRIIYYPAGRYDMSYSIPESVVSIGDYAFYCSGLVTVDIPYSVKSIGWWSFTFSPSLNEVKIPYTVEEIGCNAFWDCDKVTLLCVKDTAGYEYAVSYDVPYKLYTDDTMPALNKNEVVLYAGGASFTLKLNNAVNNKVVWKSDNLSVVTVKNGVLTPKAKGKAIITAIYNGISCTCKVTVKNPSINVSALTLEVRETSTLKVYGYSSNVKWSSSNPGIAAVDKTGLVTAIKTGKATISAKVGKKTYQCQVTVKANVSDALLKYVDISVEMENEQSNSSTRYPTINVTNSNKEAVYISGELYLYDAKDKLVEQKAIYLYVAAGAQYRDRLGVLPDNIAKITSKNLTCVLADQADADKKSGESGKGVQYFQKKDVNINFDITKLVYDKSKGGIVVPYTVTNASAYDVRCSNSLEIYYGDILFFSFNINNYCAANSSYDGEIIITYQSDITENNIDINDISTLGSYKINCIGISKMIY